VVGKRRASRLRPPSCIVQAPPSNTASKRTRKKRAPLNSALGCMKICTCLVWCVLCAICLLLAGCGPDQSTVWSTNATSPNGQLVASARKVTGGGFGSAYAFTAVYLAQGSQSPGVRVLQFGDPFGCGKVVLHWVSNSQLSVVRSCGPVPKGISKALGVTVKVLQGSPQTQERTSQTSGGTT
jgi:hypothetical protein